MPQPVVFDHYEVLTRDDGSLYELGRGAMGVTYKAFDTNLRVPVALKVINAAYLDNDIARQRFVREAQSAAKLRHRNVATVYHLGTETDAWFYAMEFIDGETVDALVRRHGALEPLLALQIAAQVCRALNAAMPHGLVHRDIKPANLMLVREDEELVVKVIDFGLALSVQGDEKILESGFVGTPHFASPEQLKTQEVDVRSDLYSLGVTLWFMLAGRAPFSGSVKQVAQHHLHTPPPFDQVSGLSAPVLAVLHKSLEKDPAQRHRTPQDFRRAIEDAITQIPQIAGTAGPGMIEPRLGELPPDAQATVIDTDFEIGSVIAGRYKILQPASTTNTGRTFRCYDREQQRDVRLLVLHAEFTGPAFTQLEREVEKIAPVAHENLLRVDEFATSEEMSFVVTEWTEGFTFLELLRARRELAAAETLALLQQTARGVDHALRVGITSLDFALHQIAIHFPQSIDREKLLRSPLLTWPPFTVKLNPLGVSQELAASSQTWAGGQTMVHAPPVSGEGVDARVRTVQAVAAVAYELLGGATSPLHGSRPGNGGTNRYTPIATLSEEGNEVLKRALHPETCFPSAEEFYQALKKLEVLGVRPITIHTPSVMLNAAELAPPPATRVPPPTAPRPRRVPVKFLGSLLTVAAIGAGVYFLTPRETTPPVTDAPVAETPTPVDEPPSAPPPPPPREDPPAPMPDRAALLRQALSAAEVAEQAGDPEEAVRAWLKVAREFPESDVPRRRLDFVIDPLRKRSDLQKPEVFAALQPLLVEAAQIDSLSAVLLLAEALKTKNPKESFAWWSTAAAKGRPEAPLQMGLLLSNGVDGPPDLEKAFYYFTTAAEAGDLAAKTALAECYLLGKGTPADPERGVKWLKEAADEGSLRAINRLADSYNRGRYGLPTNYNEAYRLWAKVVETKDAGGLFRQPIGEANGNLGTLYLSGHGPAIDERRAIELFTEGVRLEDPGSMYYLGVCMVEGSAGVPQQRTAGQQLIVRGAERRHLGAQNWCRNNSISFTPK